MKPIARTDDPTTSHEAAIDLTMSGARGEMCTIALELVRKHPDSTANELEKIAEYTNGQIRKRLNDLLHDGKVVKSGTRICAISKRRATTWRVVDHNPARDNLE